MRTTNARTSIARDLETLDRVERLLKRYPEVSPSDCDTIGHFLRRGAPIDIGLLSSDQTTWRAAERFKAENPHYFRIRAGTYVGWVVAIALVIVTLLLLKDCAVKH